MEPRIIAGKYKGQKLKVPNSARPITDRIKQSVFDTVSSTLAGAQVLDLFAGSGSIGIEALSRGAVQVTFVEQDREAVATLRQNLLKLKIAYGYTIHNLPVEKFLNTERAKYNVIFVDPPFITANQFPLRLLKKCLAPNGLVVFRYPAKSNAPQPLISLPVIREQRFGESIVQYLSMLPSSTEE